MNKEIKELNPLNINLYKCISEKIATEKVILTDKQILHMIEHHPEAYSDVLAELNDTLASPDYIIRDEKHDDTGLVIRKLTSDKTQQNHTFIVLRICSDTKNGILSNSIISGWKISDKRLQSYLRNKTILYKNE